MKLYRVQFRKSRLEKEQERAAAEAKVIETNKKQTRDGKTIRHCMRSCPIISFPHSNSISIDPVSSLITRL